MVRDVPFVKVFIVIACQCVSCDIGTMERHIDSVNDAEILVLFFVVVSEGSAIREVVIRVRGCTGAAVSVVLRSFVQGFDFGDVG